MVSQKFLSSATILASPTSLPLLFHFSQPPLGLFLLLILNFMTARALNNSSYTKDKDLIFFSFMLKSCVQNRLYIKKPIFASQYFKILNNIYTKSCNTSIRLSSKVIFIGLCLCQKSDQKMIFL